MNNQDHFIVSTHICYYLEFLQLLKFFLTDFFHFPLQIHSHENLQLVKIVPHCSHLDYSYLHFVFPSFLGLNGDYPKHIKVILACCFHVIN